MDHVEYNQSRQSVELTNGKMAFAEVGRGPVALFVHGVFTSCHLWRNALGELSEDRRCVAVDLPAHGRTELDLPDLSLPALAELLEEFCEAIGLTRVDLVANDTGGAISQIFAARHPERIRTATFTNCDVHDQVPPDNFRDAADAAAQGQLAPVLTELGTDPELARATALAQCYEDVGRLPVETIEEYLGGFASPGRARQVESMINSMRAEDLIAVEPQLADLEAPTLIAWGTGDVFFDVKWAYWLRDAIAGAETVVEIPGAKLFYPDERAGELVPHVREHWSRHAPVEDAARSAT